MSAAAVRYSSSNKAPFSGMHVPKVRRARGTMNREPQSAPGKDNGGEPCQLPTKLSTAWTAEVRSSRSVFSSSSMSPPSSSLPVCVLRWM